jgi:hypothetical protein
LEDEADLALLPELELLPLFACFWVELDDFADLPLFCCVVAMISSSKNDYGLLRGSCMTDAYSVRKRLRPAVNMRLWEIQHSLDLLSSGFFLRVILVDPANIHDRQQHLQHDDGIGFHVHAPDCPKHIAEQKAPEANLAPALLL